MVETVADKKENTFMVRCGNETLAKAVARHIAETWDKVLENWKEPGTYANDLVRSGDLLACVPCTDTVMVWFDINTGDGHEEKFERIHKFVDTAVVEAAAGSVKVP